MKKALVRFENALFSVEELLWNKSLNNMRWRVIYGVWFMTVFSVFSHNTWRLYVLNQQRKWPYLRTFAQTFWLFFWPQIPFLVFDAGQARTIAGLLPDLLIYPAFSLLGQRASYKLPDLSLTEGKGENIWRKVYATGWLINIVALIIPIAVTWQTQAALLWDLHLVSVVHFFFFAWFFARLGIVIAAIVIKSVPLWIRTMVLLIAITFIPFYCLGVVDFIGIVSKSTLR